ncbi:MAG: hypothetical protein ACRDJU_11780 [Actinomycetota bacterium]
MSDFRDELRGAFGGDAEAPLDDIVCRAQHHRRQRRAALAVGSAVLLVALAAFFVTRPAPRHSVSVHVVGTPAPTATATVAAPSPATTASPSGSPSGSSASLTCSSADYGSSYNTPSATVSVTLGDTAAQVRWTGRTPTGFIKGGEFQLTQGGVTLASLPIGVPTPPDSTPAWSGDWESIVPLCLEVPASGPPVAFINGYAGEMTCCAVERVYYQGPGGSYLSADRDLGRDGSTVTVLNGKVVISSGNPTFEVRFACAACGDGPVQIWQVSGGRYVDVTRQFPDQIAAQAAQLWSQASPQPAQSLGLLAPWAADECELGHETSAYNTLDSLAAEGKLSPSPDPTESPLWPAETSYVSSLKAFLVAQGYCT